MNIRQWLLPPQATEAAFRRVPEGWLFHGPGARPFGRGCTYLLDDVRKAQVIAAIDPVRLSLLVAGLIGLMTVVCVGVSVWTQGSVLATLGATGIFGVALVLTINRATFRALRPILASAPVSAEPFTPADQLRIRADTTPMAALVAIAASMGLLALLKARSFVLAASWTSEAMLDLASMVLFGAIALADIVMIGIKLGRRP